tara:strand:- start:650 stop:1654 length:1005 start_codon:yes stop_codon:yes gene_type:complete
MQTSVAVVILNWNGLSHLKTFLPSVVEYSMNAKIYLADNASTDNSAEFVKQNYPEIGIIHNSENGGYAKGYNKALQQLNEDYFVLLNSDVEVTKNWIEPVIEFLESTEKAVVAQPKIKSYLEKDTFEYAGAAGGFIDALGYPFCQGRIFQCMEKDQGQYDEIKEVFWASGACMFIAREQFELVNGFEARYFAHMEEIDLCWRLKNLGYKVHYIPTSTVYHLGGGTMKNTNPRKTFLNFRNSLLSLYKNDRTPYRSMKVIARLLLDGLAFVKLLIDNGLNHALAIIKAHYSFFFMKKKRSEVTSINLKGQYKGSIVLDHFYRKIKRFQDLKKGFR